MHDAPEHTLLSSDAKSPPKLSRAPRSGPSRWFLTASVIALLVATGTGVRSAFASMAKQDAYRNAFHEATRVATDTTGTNSGQEWTTIATLPEGPERLAEWFGALETAWPAACASEMARISQSAASCLPVAQTLAPELDAALGAGTYAELSASHARLMQQPPAEPETETLAEELPVPAPARPDATVRPVVAVAAATVPAPAPELALPPPLAPTPDPFAGQPLSRQALGADLEGQPEGQVATPPLDLTVPPAAEEPVTTVTAAKD